MANKRSAKSIAIEKSILNYIVLNSINEFTSIDLLKGVKDFSKYRYVKRTIWSILKILVNKRIIIKTGKKRDQADCYRILGISRVKDRINQLEDKPILSKKNISYESNRVVLSSSQIGKHIIDYINSIELQLTEANNKVAKLELKLKELEGNLIAASQENKIQGRVQAGNKMFIFDNMIKD